MDSPLFLGSERDNHPWLCDPLPVYFRLRRYRRSTLISRDTARRRALPSCEDGARRGRWDRKLRGRDALLRRPRQGARAPTCVTRLARCGCTSKNAAGHPSPLVRGIRTSSAGPRRARAQARRAGLHGDPNGEGLSLGNVRLPPSTCRSWWTWTGERPARISEDSDRHRPRWLLRCTAPGPCRLAPPWSSSRRAPVRSDLGLGEPNRPDLGIHCPLIRDAISIFARPRNVRTHFPVDSLFARSRRSMTFPRRRSRRRWPSQRTFHDKRSVLRR